MPQPLDHLAHHNGYNKGLELTLSVCLCYTLCVLGLRLYLRWRAFGPDDYVILLSTVRFPSTRPLIPTISERQHLICGYGQAFAFVFFGCSYASSAAGLGRLIEFLGSQQDTIDRLNALTLVSNMSWFTALCLSKLAIVAMLLRTTQTTAHRRLQYFVGALVSAQWVLSITLVTARCTTFNDLTWDFRSNGAACSRQQLRWRVVTGLDVATEVAILVLPVQLVWKLQMSVKNKCIVIVALWLRLP